MADVILIDIPGLEGTSQVTGFEKKIECLSYSHGVAMQVTTDVSNTERTSGRSMHQDFNLTKYIDKTTPMLNQHCCEGKAFATATITIGRNDTGAVIPLIVYTLSNVVISNVSVSGGGGDKPVENFSLNYASIKWDFSTQKEAGGKEGTVQGKWDISTNKAA
ncbi:MAG: type VI secretion system tube protein Hcp [Gemmatimonadota bacterium]